MRQEVKIYLEKLFRQKIEFGLSTGWVYGQLRQKFPLEESELEELSYLLGFKKGWNSGLEDLLEHQWSEERNIMPMWEKLPREEEKELKRKKLEKQYSSNLMRREIEVFLSELLLKKSEIGLNDGWVYGRLKQEFSLEEDELEKLAFRLGFKRGWNPGLEELLEHQWSKDKDTIQTLGRIRREKELREKTAITLMHLTKALKEISAFPKEYSDTEIALFVLITKLNSTQQETLLKEFCVRFSSQI